MFSTFHIVPNIVENQCLLENILIENKTRLKLFQKTRACCTADKSEFTLDPKWKPMVSATEDKMAEIKNYKKLKMEARKKFCPALTKQMFKAELAEREVLIEYMPDSDQGFTKRYIEKRILQPPLKRYTYRLLTSMSYGSSDCYDENFCGPIFGKRTCYKRSNFTDNHFPDINLGGKLYNDAWK